MVGIFETSFAAVFAVSAMIFAMDMPKVLAIVGTLWHFAFVSACCRCSGVNDALYQRVVQC